MTPLNRKEYPDPGNTPASLPGPEILLKNGELRIYETLPPRFRSDELGACLGAVLAASKFSYPGATRRLLVDIEEGFLREEDLFALQRALTDEGRLRNLQRTRWRFIFQIMRAVSKYDATRPDLGVAARALGDYRGQYAQLREVFFTIMRKRPNLILLPDRVEFVFPGPGALAACRRRVSPGGEERNRSASGQRVLAGRSVLAFDADTPGKGTILGIPAAISVARLLRQVLEHRSYSGGPQAENASETPEVARAWLLDLKLRRETAGAAESSERPSSRRAGRLPIMEELRDYRDQLRRALEHGLRGESVLEIAEELHFLKEDRRRGALLRWIGSLRRELPPAVVQAYRNLSYKDSLVSMSAEEEALQWEILTFFKIQNSYISAAVLVAPLQEDKLALESLSSDDPLYPEARRVLKRLPDLGSVRTGQQVTLEHIGHILEQGLLGIREKLCERVWLETSSGIAQARAFINEISRETDRSSGLLPLLSQVKDIPMFQVRARSRVPFARGDLVFTAADYEALARFAAADHILLGDQSRISRAFSVSQTTQLLKEAAFAGHKLARIERLSAVQGCLPEESMPQPGDRPLYLTGGREEYVTSAELAGALATYAGESLTLEEMIERADSQQHRRKNWPSLRWKMLREVAQLAVETGYFPRQELCELLTAAREVARLVPTDSAAVREVSSDVQALIETARLASVRGPFSISELRTGAWRATGWIYPEERDYLIFLAELHTVLQRPEFILNGEEDSRWREISDACIVSRESGKWRLQSAREIALCPGAVEIESREQILRERGSRHSGFTAQVFPASGVREAVRRFEGAEECPGGSAYRHLPKEAKEAIGTRVRGLRSRKVFICRAE